MSLSWVIIEWSDNTVTHNPTNDKNVFWGATATGQVEVGNTVSCKEGSTGRVESIFGMLTLFLRLNFHAKNYFLALTVC